MDAKYGNFKLPENLGHIKKSPDYIDIIKLILVDKSDTEWLLFP